MSAVAGLPACGTSRPFSARITSGVWACTAFTCSGKEGEPPPRSQSRMRPTSWSPVRRRCSGCRYTVIGVVVAGGSTARPLPSTPAPRPIPLFSVVRIGKGRPFRQAPAAREDTRRLGSRSFRSGFGEELRDGEERVALRVDAALLVGAGAAAEHLLDERELSRPAEPSRRGLGQLDEVA